MANRHYGLIFRNPGKTMPKHSYRVAEAKVNPPSIDLVEKPLPAPFEPCLDQLALGACGPNALAESIVFDELENGEEDVVLPSRLWLYYIARRLMGTLHYDSGVVNADMFAALGMFGFADEPLCPYHIAHFRDRPSETAFKQAARRLPIDHSIVPQDIDQIRACLAARKTFVLGFRVYPAFESDQVEKTGIVPMPSNTQAPIGGHDVLAVGYDDVTKTIKFKNSWGPKWGDHGYGYMPYDYAVNPYLSGDYWTADHSGRP